MPNLYVELRQSVLGVGAPEDTQMEGPRAKTGPDLGMFVPAAGKPWGQSTRARHNPAGSGRMKPGEVAFFFSL